MNQRRPMLLFSLVALVAMLGIGLSPTSAATPATPATTTIVSNITFLGEDQLYPGYLLGDEPVGGFSGITYTTLPMYSFDGQGINLYGWRDVYYAVSHDPSGAAPPRIYQVDVHLDDNQLNGGDVFVAERKELFGTNGAPITPLNYVPEGIAMTGAGSVFVTAEDAFDRNNPLINQFVSEFFIESGQISAARQSRIYTVPYQFLPITHGGLSGMRNSMGLESATITPDKAFFFTATANALTLDGPAASLTRSSPSRIVRYNVATGAFAGQYIYPVEQVADPPIPADGTAMNSLVDMVALDNMTLLSLERSYSAGVGYRVKLYLTSLAGATDVTNIYSLIPVHPPLDPVIYTPVQKTLLLDLDSLGIPIDNIEGMTLGPILPNGQRALILVSDNRFSATQPTQFLAFGITMTPPPFATAQPAYIKPVAAGVSVTPLLTAGDELPQPGNPERHYRMVGIPSGLGAYKADDGSVKVLINHAIEPNDYSIALPSEQSRGYDIPEGLLRGSYPSEITLTDQSPPAAIGGDIAFVHVQEYDGDLGEYHDRTLDWLYFERSFSNLGAGYLAGPTSGFSENIYLAGEKSQGAATFDGLGGIGVAITDGIAYTLPELGHFAKGAISVLPGTGNQTVVFATEDSWNLDSHLYMYIGTKNPAAENPIKRAGLVGGDLYVFGAQNPSQNHEASVHGADGPIAGHWVKVQDILTAGEQVWNVPDDVLNMRVTAAGAFGFVRLADLTADHSLAGTLYLATTGSMLTVDGHVVNRLGRITRLTIDPGNLVDGPTTLSVLLDGDAGDPIVNPHSLDINEGGILAISEAPISENCCDSLLDARGRDSSVWAYDVPGDGKGTDGSLVRIAEIDPTAGARLPAYNHLRGTWQSSIRDVSAIYGPGTWLVLVNAAFNRNDASLLAGSSDDLKLVGGGQLLLLRTP